MAEPAALLRSWGQWAQQQGGRIHADFVQSLRTINYRLTYELQDWGESREYLTGLDLVLRVGSNLMLSVWYGIKEPENVVFIVRVHFVRSYPHGQPPLK